MVGTAIGAAVSIGGALIGGSSASKAAKTQAKAADQAAQEQLQAAQIASNTALSMYGSTKASLAPYTNTGTAALNQLAMMYGLPVYTAPTPESQTPQIPSVGGSAAPGGGFGLTTDPHAGMTSTAPSAQQQIDWIRANITSGNGHPNAGPKMQQYLATHPGQSPEQTLAGLQALFGGGSATQDYNSWVQGATTWAPSASTGPAAGAVPPGNGQPTIPNFTAMLDSLTKTPGYQFGLQQGQLALEHSAAKGGMTLSGAQLKDAQQFGTNYAIQAGWNPYVSQLNSFASLGQNSAAMTGNAGTLAAGQVGTALEKGATGAGNAQLIGSQAIANGQLAQGKAWQDILGTVGSFF